MTRYMTLKQLDKHVAEANIRPQENGLAQIDLRCERCGETKVFANCQDPDKLEGDVRRWVGTPCKVYEVTDEPD